MFITDLNVHINLLVIDITYWQEKQKLNSSNHDTT